MGAYRRYDLIFFTATILEWKPVLFKDEYKYIITGSLDYLVRDKRIYLCGFCIMNNHMHLLLQIIEPHKLDDVQRDFLKYTSQMILKDLRNNDQLLLETLRVNAKDRKYQVWERNPLSVPVRSEAVLIQKLNYIHDNPVKARLCKLPEEYLFSSAYFYETGEDNWGFMSHYLFD